MGDGLNEEQSKSSLAILQQLTEEIPSGVSSEDVGRILKLIALPPEETMEYIAKQITVSLKAALELFWEEFQLDKKLQSLPSSEYRYDVNKIKMKYLQRQKLYLEQMLSKTYNKINKNYDYLEANLKEIRQLEEKMESDA